VRGQGSFKINFRHYANISTGGTDRNHDKSLIFYIFFSVYPVMIHWKWPIWRTVLFYVFISILYMFRATSCSSSGQSIVSIQRLVYATLCRWPFHVQVGSSFPACTRNGHRHRVAYNNIIIFINCNWVVTRWQRLYWYNWFSWWWAQRCSKHV